MDLIVDGVELGEDDPVDEAGLLRHGVVGQSLIKLHLRTRGPNTHSGET